MHEKLDINQAIVSMYGQLSPSARVIANYIQQNPLAILSMSLADLANATSTSKATVSRFFRSLGYSSHQQAKNEMRLRRETGFPLAQKNSKDNNHLTSDISLLNKTMQGIEPAQLRKIVTLILKSPKVSIIGFRNSYPLALHFRQQLKQIRPSVNILPQPGQTLSEELIDLDKNDFIILLGFRRRPKVFNQLIKNLAGKKTLLITDPTGQAFNQEVKHIIVCHLGNENAFDSYCAPMSVISMLCNQVYQAKNADGQTYNRVEDISKLYKDLDELSNI